MRRSYGTVKPAPAALIAILQAEVLGILGQIMEQFDGCVTCLPVAQEPFLACPHERLTRSNASCCTRWLRHRSFVKVRHRPLVTTPYLYEAKPKERCSPTLSQMFAEKKPAGCRHSAVRRADAKVRSCPKHYPLDAARACRRYRGYRPAPPHPDAVGSCSRLSLGCRSRP